MSFLISDFTVDSTFVFRDLALDLTVTVPGDNLQFADKINVVVYGLPELDSGYGVNDIRIQVNGRDITSTVRQNLIAQLNALPNFSATYASVMTQWLDFRAAFGVLDTWLAAERAAATALSQVAPATLLAMLGNKNNGFNGELDVFNFLYRRIKMAPVDIRPLLTPADLNADLTFNLSTGPSPILNPGTWSVDQAYGHGAAYLGVRAVFTNPIDDALTQIANDVTAIGQVVGNKGPIQTQLGTLSADTDLIYQRVSSTGPIQKQLINAQTQLQQVATSLVTSNQELSNVQAALDEIRKIFPQG